MNSITVGGTVVADSILKFMPNGDAILNFRMADNQFGKDRNGKEKEAIFWNCSLFGKRGESLAPSIARGQAVTVIGVVNESEWMDKNGQPRKGMDIRVTDVLLQGGRKNSEQQQAPAPAPAPAIDDDDIPF